MTCASLLEPAVRQLSACHIEEARLDAELLLAAACGRSRAWLPAHGDTELSEAERLRFVEFIERRAQHEPVAYILAHKEFYGLELLVDRRVLIPRPETETLVEHALAWLGQASIDAGKPALPHPGIRLSTASHLRVVDVGTGSGAVAIAIAAHTPDDRVHIIAGDVSPGALAVAGANAARHDVSRRITFVQSDLLACIAAPADLIVANLPYVADAEWDALAPDIAAFEPRLALHGGADGLDLYRGLFAQAPAHLAPGGVMLVEIGWQQADAVRALARAAFPRAQVDIVPDLSGQDRVAVVVPASTALSKKEGAG